MPVRAVAEECVAQYLDFAGRRFIERRRQYPLLRALELFRSCIGEDSVGEALVAAKDSARLARAIQLFINRLEEGGRRPKTILFYLDLLCGFLRFHDVPYEAALRKVRRPRNAATRVDRVPTVAELRRMILKCRSPRLAMLIQLLAQTGLRLSEATRLRLKHLDLDGGWIRLTGDITKNGRPRDVPIVSELGDALRSYIVREKIADYLFPNLADRSRPMRPNRVYESYHGLLRRLGLAERDDVGWRLHVHTLRKWFKTQLESAGVNRLLIMSWMGHDAGVQAVYYLPTREQVGAEVERAERALAIFSDEGRSVELDRVRELESEVAALKMILRGVLSRLEESHSRRGASMRP
jgi:integrase